jgi:hypothetical protein
MPQIRTLRRETPSYDVVRDDGLATKKVRFAVTEVAADGVLLSWDRNNPGSGLVGDDRQLALACFEPVVVIR